jgi:hypothetical protein
MAGVKTRDRLSQAPLAALNAKRGVCHRSLRRSDYNRQRVHGARPTCIGIDRAAGGVCGAQPDLMRAPSDTPELFAQLTLGAGQYAPPRLWEIGASTIDVESQHRKRGAKGIGLFPIARLGRALEGRGDLLWVSPRENPRLQIKRVACPRYFGGPKHRLLTRRRLCARSLAG